jgi:hypothetical protein
LMKGCDVNGLPLDASHEFFGVTPSKDEQLGELDRTGKRKLTYFGTRRP